MVSTIDHIEKSSIFVKLVIMPKELELLSEKEDALMDDFQQVYNYKCCPTRHGCSGATNCDHAYGNYHR